MVGAAQRVMCLLLQDVLWWTLYKAENLLLGSWLRKKALAECMKHIHYEVRCCCGCVLHIQSQVWVRKECARAAHVLQGRGA